MVARPEGIIEMFKERYNKSIRFKFLSVLSVILFIGTLVISLVIALNESRILKNSLMTTGQSFASYIAKLSRDPLVTKDSVQLDAIVNDANKDEDIAYSIIFDKQGAPVTTQYASINYRLLRISAVLSGLSSQIDFQNIIKAIKKKEPIIEVSTPVMIGLKTIGGVTIGMSAYKMHQQIVGTILFVIALNLAMAFVLGAVLFVALRKIVLNPLIEISRASSRLAKGDLSTEVKVGVTGEVKTLVDSFNEMVKSLQKVTVSKDYVDNIIGSMINMLIVVSPDDNIIRVNDAACKILGYEEEELIGRPAETVLGGERSRKDSWMKTMLADGRIGHIEESYRAKNGYEIPVLLSASIMYDDNRLIRGTVYVAEDITERKQTEVALQEKTAELQAVFDTIPDRLFRIDGEGVIKTYYTGKVVAPFLAPEKYMDKDLGMLLPPETASKLMKTGLEVLHTGKPATEDYSFMVEGKEYIFEARMLPFLQGQIIGMVRNITERKQEEELLRQAMETADAANKAKSDFLANMSHELRTPLNAVIGFSEVLRDQYFGPLNDKQTEYTTDILESGKHLLNLINDILDLSKVEAGKMELELSPVIVGELLRSSLIMIKEKALKHGINLVTEIPEELSHFETLADERKVKQILYNLLSNAAKFTPDGGSITLSVRRTEENERDIIEVSVKDTGIGIAPEHQDHIFESFYQVQSSAKDKTPGTGLGLALSRRFVEIQGGRIWVESEGEGKGSRFYFRLPIKAITPTVPAALVETTGQAVPIEPVLYAIDKHPNLLFHLERIVSLSRRYNKTFSFCYISIRGNILQRKINEIKEVTENNKRLYDFAVFVEGGIALLLQETDEATARITCERLVTDIISKVETFEASFSIVSYPSAGETPQELITKLQSTTK